MASSTHSASDAKDIDPTSHVLYQAFTSEARGEETSCTNAHVSLRVAT